MVIRFPFVVLGATMLLGGIIYILHLLGLVTSANEVYMRFSAWGLFITGFALTGWQKAKNHRFSWNDFYKNNTLIIVSLSALLSSLFLMKRISFYMIALFTVASFIRFLYTRKFYAPPKFFYFLFAYALLLFFGTIGTQEGFRFPDKILSFFLLPLAFCCFSLPKKTLLQIGDLFFKTGIIFLVVIVLYWFFNFLHLDGSFTSWITGKNNYGAQMTGWELQAQALGHVLAENIIIYYPAHFFVNSWSYLFHPTANAFVLLGGLMVVFYLYFEKNSIRTITKWDLLLYAALCLFTFMLLGSRIGIVGFLLVIGIAGLYYLKLRTKYFKIGLAAYFLFGGISLVLFQDKVSGFVNDEIRDAYRRIAVSYIQEHFWWGSGFGQDRLAMNAQAEKMKDTLPEIVLNTPITHVHNQFLGNMVQFGVWGLIALIVMLAAIAYYAVKNRSYLLLTFLCFMLVFMMIEENEYIKMLVFITFFTAISESEKSNKKIVNLGK